MDMTDSIAVSVSALDAQRHRLNVIASNLANAHPLDDKWRSHRRRDVVFQTTQVAGSFQSALRQAASGSHPRALDGVKVARIIEDHKPGQATMIPAIPTPIRKGL